MVVRAINGLFTASMSAAWKPVRSFYDGASGTTHLNGMSKTWRGADGKSTRRTPGGKLAQRLKADTKQMITGNKYNPATGEVIDTGRGWLGRQTLGRAGGVAHAVGDLTLGTAGTALGWGARTVIGGAAMTTPHIARGAGHLAYQGARDGLGFTKDAVGLLHSMSKNPVGSNVLFGAGAVGVAGYAAADTLTHQVTKDRVGFYMNNQVESLPGTLGAQGADEGSQAMVNTGADGDLVFALHNMR